MAKDTQVIENLLRETVSVLKEGGGSTAELEQAITNAKNAILGEDITATNTAIMQAIFDNAGIPVITIPSTTAAQELAPNTLYIFSERTTDLTLTLGTPIVGIVNEYHFFITTGSTAPTITWPSGISWNGGSAPTIAADKTYEVSILNNIAAFFEV